MLALSIVNVHSTSGGEKIFDKKVNQHFEDGKNFRNAHDTYFIIIHTFSNRPIRAHSQDNNVQSKGIGLSILL